MRQVAGSNFVRGHDRVRAKLREEFVPSKVFESREPSLYRIQVRRLISFRGRFFCPGNMCFARSDAPGQATFRPKHGGFAPEILHTVITSHTYDPNRTGSAGSAAEAEHHMRMQGRMQTSISSSAKPTKP